MPSITDIVCLLIAGVAIGMEYGYAPLKRLTTWVTRHYAQID